jgi:hypothetical protein
VHPRATRDQGRELAGRKEETHPKDSFLIGFTHAS